MHKYNNPHTMVNTDCVCVGVRHVVATLLISSQDH